MSHHGFRRRVLLGLGVTALIALAAAPASAATRTPAATPTPSGPEYGVRALLTGRTTLSHNHFAYALPAGGASIADAIVVSNYTRAPLTFSVHGADMVSATGGGMAPAAEGATPQQVGAWISVQRAQITVPPRGEVDDPFTVDVPAGQQAGEFLGAVVVARSSSDAKGVHVLTRAALTVDVTVLQKAELKAAAGPLAAVLRDGGEHFTVAVHNRGNVLFTFTGEVEVRDGSGNLVATIPLDPTGLYVIPGGEATVSGTWSGLPLWGTVSAVATIHASTSGGSSVTARSAALSLGFFPWVLVIAAGAGLLAALLAFLLIRRRRTRSA